MKGLILIAALFGASLACHAANRTFIWPDCDTTHPCVVHHIDTVSAGTAFGETLQDFKFPMVSSSAGNLLTLTVTHVSTKSITVTDNHSGSWQTAITTTNAADHIETELLYICGAAVGTNLITIHLSQAAVHDEVLQFSYNEVSGIAPSSCLDGATGANGLTATLLQPGAITTTADGDLIYNFAEETYAFPEQDAPITRVLPDSSSAMLMENTFDKFASQVSIQTAHGIYNPTLTVIGSSSARNWNSVAAAFKAASGAGTQPTGIHVTRILHYINPLGSMVSVPFPSTGNAIVLSTPNPSVGYNMGNLADNSGNTYTRTHFVNSNTDPQIYSTCLGAVTGSRDLTITWTPDAANTHLLIYDIAGAGTTAGSTGCVGATVNNITGLQPSSANANITGDPIITPTAANSLVIATTYLGIGPPSSTLTPNVVFNSVWATGMIDSSSWDTGDPFGYIYTTSTSPISFNWQMQNLELPNGGTFFDGAAIEILPQAVVPGPLASTTTVTSSLNPSAQGQSVTFTSTAAGLAGSVIVPTGTVKFMDGATTLGLGTLNGSAQATLATSALTIGAHSITAVYAGDANFAGSTSSVLTQTVSAAGFAVGVNPTTSTVTAGQSGSATVTVTPFGGFNQQVSFSCSGLPAASTCTFAPATVTPNGTSAATSTLTIATNVATASVTRPAPNDGSRSKIPSPKLLALLLLGLTGLVRNRRSRKIWILPLALVATLGMAIAGCGGGTIVTNGGTGSGGTTTPAGTSTVTVIATAGSLTHTATFTLTVR